ncbi:MAG: diguanylate cyclase domain-containing protein [Sulfuriferula sp.]
MANRKAQFLPCLIAQKHVDGALEGCSNHALPKENKQRGRVIDMKYKNELFTSPDIGGHMGRAVLLLDECGLIKYCSPAALNYFGVSLQVMIGKSVTSLLPEFPGGPSAPDDNPAYISSVSGNEDGKWQACHGCDSKGRKFSLEMTQVQLELEGRNFLLLEMRRQQTHADAQEQLHRIQEVSELSADAVVITNTEGVIVYVNAAFEALSGYRKEEAIGRTHAILKTGKHDDKFYAHMWEVLLTNAVFRGQFINRHKNGTHFHEDKIIRPLLDSKGKTTHFIASGRDVSERVKIMQRLEHFANYDSLTGLPNRNLFMDRLQQAQAHAFRSGENFALLLLDVDRFKAINDSFGHAVGDVILQTAALRLKQCVRNEDTVARLGGDEFCLILEKTALRRDVKKVLEKISVMLREPLTVDGHDIAIQASIGVAFYPEHGEDGHTLLKQADDAMYRIKANGGDGYLFVDKKETRRRAGNDGFFAGG